MTERSFSVARGRVVAALVAAGLLLSACQGGGPTPGTSPSASNTSASPSATPTPTPTPSAKYVPASAKGKAQNVPVPVKPALADQNSKAGLEAFTKYWFALLDYGYQTGDTATWLSLASANCVFCSTLKEGIESDYKNGGWMVGGRIQTPSVEVVTTSAERVQKVTVQVVQSAAATYKSDGSKGARQGGAGNHGAVILAVHEGGAWSVSDMHPLK